MPSNSCSRATSPKTDIESLIRARSRRTACPLGWGPAVRRRPRARPTAARSRGWPATAVPGVIRRGRASCQVYLRGLRALRALLDLVADLLAFGQLPVALAVDRAVVHEDVLLAVVLGDEPVALLGVEPLHRAGSHARLSRSVFARSRTALAS